MRNERIGLAVVGCGDIAVTRHLPAIVAQPAVRLVATCDLDARRAADAADAFGATWSSARIEDVLADPAVEALVVATPPWASPAITIAGLEAGRDVLTEKPMAVSLDDAERVAAAADASHGLLQIGFTYRHDPLILQLRDWIADGRLGRPLIFRLGIFDERWDPQGNPEHADRMLATLRHGPPAIHDGAHVADHLNLLTGSRAVRVWAAGTATDPEFAAPNHNLAWVEFENGDRASVEIGWLLPQLPKGQFEVLGPAGCAWFDRDRREVGMSDRGRIDRRTLTGDYLETAFRLQLEEFVDAIQTRRQPVPGPEEGIASLALTKAIERAMASGTWQPVSHRGAER